MSLLEQLRTSPNRRYLENYVKIITKEEKAAALDARTAVMPDPLIETNRSLGAWSEDSRRTSNASRQGKLPPNLREAFRQESEPAPDRKSRTGSAADGLSRSSSLPHGSPMRATVPSCFGSGFLGKPCYINPLADKSLGPSSSVGVRLEKGPEYIPCRSYGSMGFMHWEGGRSYKSPACLAREERQRSEGLSAGEPAVGAPLLEPPKPPPWGFGAAPARIRNHHCDFYWGC